MGNDPNKNTKNLMHLYLLDKKIKHHKEIPPMKCEKIYFIQKDIVDRYKELCHYEEINDFFENNNIITELNENNISDIIEQIPEKIINKIENINEDYLLYELTKENNNQWKYKSLKIENNKRINYIDDFEMIDKDLKEFFKDKNFKVLKGKYVIGNKGIFIYITYEKTIEKKTESSVFEFGNFDKNGNFNIEYLLDQNEIGNPSYFLNRLLDEGIDYIFNKILKQEKTDIKFKISLLSYPYNFYIFNDINKDYISNYKINSNTLYESSIYRSTVLNEKINELENKLKQKEDLINDYIEKISKLQNSLIRKTKEIEKLKKEMEQLKIKLSKFPFELSEKEELVSIVIRTIDENINVNFFCKNTDKFRKIEKDFYNKYPEYKNLNNYFTFKGNKINPLLSLDENKIKNNNIVDFISKQLPKYK